MKITKGVKKIVIKIDDFREETLEEFVSKDILKRWDEFKNAKQLRKAASLAVINFVEAYIGQSGALPDDVKDKIAEQSADILHKLNNRLQKQLDKKSKAYLKRHQAEIKEVEND